MKENEIRDFVLNLASRYLGCKTGDQQERELVDIYNKYTPKSRPAKVGYKDAWCATFVSAIEIIANYADITPIECGCGEMVALAKGMGIYHGREFTPQKGDIVMYDWESKKDGWADHTGFVEEVGDNYITTIEGNTTSGVCARRTVMQSDPNIAGYITPNYASKVTKNPETIDDIAYAEAFDPAVAGSYTVVTGLYLRKGAGTRYKSVTVMKKGEKVRNYGYYTVSNNTPWLYVRYKDVVGFCSSRYLQKDE